MKKSEILYIVVPCFNEEEVLNKTIEKLESKLSKLIKKNIVSDKSKVMFVDDGSSQ